MTRALCVECDRPGGYLHLPHGRVCGRCRRRFAYHPAACPGCGGVRPLGYRDPEGRRVCAGCAGQERSVFACTDCGREDHPYGGRRCARCILRERLTDLLTDPSTGRIPEALQPVFDTLIASERPQTTIYWLRRPPHVGPALLRQMATGQMELSHAAFEQLPADRAHNYLRDLLAAIGVLPPCESAIARMLPWLERNSPHCLPRMPWHQSVRAVAGVAASSHPRRARTADQGEHRPRPQEINHAIHFVGWLRDHGTDLGIANQRLLDGYLTEFPPRRYTLCTFVNWLPSRDRLPDLVLPAHRQALPSVMGSDEDRWRDVELLLHDDAIRLYVRIAGLFTLLFAQPLTTICRMRTDQVTLTPGAVLVTFDREPVEMPPILDELIREHLGRRGNASFASRDNGWLFPGGIPGRPLQTENVRAQLVELGIKPRDSRRTALFQLAAAIPAPVLAELIGIAPNTAVRWAALTSCSWSAYIAQR